MKQAALILAAALALAAPAQAQVAEWRTPDPQDVLVIDTSQGRVIVEMTPQVAPAHVERIRLLTRAGFYDGLKFFRVIDDFMAQTGDPENTGTGGSAQPDLQPEFSFRRGMDTPFAKIVNLPPTEDVRTPTELGFVGPLPVRSSPQMQMMITADGRAPAWGLFCAGIAGMARAQPPDSGNSQFFLMRYQNDGLNLQYTPWGRVISGLDAVRRIKVGEPVAEPMDTMRKVRLLADIPEGERPDVQVMDTRSDAFKALVAAKQAQAGSGFSICDVDIPVQIK